VQVADLVRIQDDAGLGHDRDPFRSGMRALRHTRAAKAARDCRDAAGGLPAGLDGRARMAGLAGGACVRWRA
jgi:hypothetical protein